MFGDSSVYIKNTLIYASLAGLIDVVLGVAIAYLVLRTRLVGREWLDWAATAASRFRASCSASAIFEPSTA